MNVVCLVDVSKMPDVDIYLSLGKFQIVLFFNFYIHACVSRKAWWYNLHECCLFTLTCPCASIKFCYVLYFHIGVSRA